MKVLMIGPGEPSTQNSGLGVAADNIAQKLSKKIELQVIQPNDTTEKELGENDAESIIKNLSISDDAVTKEISSIDISSNIPQYFYSEESDDIDIEANPPKISMVRKALEAYTLEIIEKAEELSFDVIYAHDWTSIPAAIDLKKRFNIPMVLHIHSLDYDRASALTNSWVYDLEKMGLEEANAIIAVSSYHAGIIEEKYNISNTKINSIHHAIDIPKLQEKKKVFTENLVVFVGRLTGQKGPEQFINIAKLILEKDKNTRFVMAGTGELMQQLIESGINASLNGKFHFTGQLTQDKILDLYAMADVYCMPSVSEPFGLTAIEAAASNVPVVLSKQSGAAEVLPGALLADYWDTEAFAEHVLRLLHSQTLCDSVIEQNVEALRKNNWGDVSDQIIQIFKQQI